MNKVTLVLLAAFAVAGAAFADVITTSAGDVINGKITGIKGGKVTIETAFAGKLSIDRTLIAKIDYSTDAQIYVRTDASSKAKELVKVSRAADGSTVLIPESDKSKALAITEVATLWNPDETDPDFPPIKRWKYSASLGFSGTSGSNKDLSMSAYIDAVRTGEASTLKLYASMNKSRSDSVTTAERYIAGADFEYNPSNTLSWYVRDEIQHNRFNDYKMRNVLGAGLGYYFWNTVTDGRTSLLRFRLGVAHTYTEHYTKKAHSDKRLTDSDVALDIGLLFHYDFTSGLGWNTELTYTPLIDDLAVGTLIHESKLTYIMKELGLVNEKLSDVSLEAGMRNEYQTQPEPGHHHTETSWYLRLSKSW